jgi:type IX secretion system PorP/SprF family membrane protein
MILKKLHTKFSFIFLVFICLFFLQINVKAQQDPLYTHYMFNKLVYNPGFAGSNREFICATFVLNNKWTGFSGKGIDPKYVGDAPSTQTFSIHAPIRKILSGIGLYAMNDHHGFENNIHINGVLSIKKDFRFGTIQLGINGGAIQKTINANWNPPDPGPDPYIPGNDASIVPDLGAGLYAYTDRYYVGFSAQHILPGSFKLGTAEVKLVTHYYLVGGYNFMLGFAPNFELQPSVLLKKDVAKMQFDLNCNVLYKNKFWGGLQYRQSNDISILLGMKLTPQLKFGYSYDLVTSKIRKYQSGTHEIMINYCFRIVIKTPEPIPNIIWNTRFL